MDNYLFLLILGIGAVTIIMVLTDRVLARTLRHRHKDVRYYYDNKDH